MSRMCISLPQDSERKLHAPSAVQNSLLDLILGDVHAGNLLVDAALCVQVVDGHPVDSGDAMDAVLDLLLIVRHERLVHKEQLVAMLVEVDRDATSEIGRAS